MGVDDIQDHLLAFTDDKGVDEIGHGLGVEGGLAAGDDQGMGLMAIACLEGELGEVQNVEDVGVERFVGQGKAEDVES